jgi:hypothetical protein
MLNVEVRAVMDSEPRMLLKTIRAISASVTSPADLANGFANNRSGWRWMELDQAAAGDPSEQACGTNAD